MDNVFVFILRTRDRRTLCLGRVRKYEVLSRSFVNKFRILWVAR
jgi:hypothetical protein